MQLIWAWPSNKMRRLQLNAVTGTIKAFDLIVKCKLNSWELVNCLKVQAWLMHATNSELIAFNRFLNSFDATTTWRNFQDWIQCWIHNRRCVLVCIVGMLRTLLGTYYGSKGSYSFVTFISRQVGKSYDSTFSKRLRF